MDATWYILGIILFVMILLLIRVLIARRHVVYEFKGHKIEVLSGLVSAKFVVDGELVDSGTRWGYDFHFDFVKKIDNDTIKIFITRKFIVPEIKIYLNDEIVKKA